jgi:hypothetical protein
MKQESLARNAMRVITQHTDNMRKQYDIPDLKVKMRPSIITAKMGNMFGVTPGGVNMGLQLLVEQGQVEREYCDGKPVFFLPDNIEAG